MYKLNRNNINVEHAKDLIILLNYLTSDNYLLNFNDSILVDSYIKKIIKIFERRCK